MTYLKSAFITILSISSLVASSDGALALPSPSALHQQLDALDAQAKTLSLYKDKSPMGIVRFAAQTAFESAERSFRECEFVATVRHLNGVLNQLPELEIEHYLKAHYLLGRSYEELGYPSRAAKAYLRYLSSYATRDGGSDSTLVEIIRRMLLLKENLLASEKDTLQRLLANLMALPLQRDLKAQITLLSSIAAYHSARFRLASDWLATLHAPDVPKQVQVEGALYEALVSLAMGKDTEGEQRLLDVAAFQEPAFLFVRDISSLNLARLYRAKGMPQNAWEWYRKVEGPGVSLRYAAYEGVLLLLQSREYAKALQLAKTFVTKYPHSQEAYHLQERLAYLQLQAGQLDPAEGDLQGRDRQLRDLQTALIADFRGKDRLQAKEVRDLKAKTEIMDLQSPLLNQGDAIFKRLQITEDRLAEQRQELNSSIYLLGRVVDRSLRPDIIARNRQLRDLTHNLFAIGDALLANEQEIFSDQLTAAEKTRLERSAQRRERLSKLDVELQKGDWRSWDRSSTFHLRMAALQSRLMRQTAALQAVKYAGQLPGARQIQRDHASRAEDFLQRTAQLDEQISARMLKGRLQMLDLIRKPSPFQQTRKELLLGSQEFVESLALLDPYRDRFQTAMKQHYQEDLEKAWLHWQKLAGTVLGLIKQEESEHAAWIDSQLAQMQSLQDRIQALADLHSRLKIHMSERVGRALPVILDHFDHHISEQQSRAKKWLADLQWQRYMQQTEDRLKAKIDHDKEEATLQENIKDLEIERSMHE